MKEPQQPKEGQGGGDGGGVGEGTLTDVGSQACRCLFGPVDHQEVRGALRREMIQLNTRDSNRWNFDFREERPLEGRYSWERLDTGGAISTSTSTTTNGSSPGIIGNTNNYNDQGEGSTPQEQPQSSSFSPQPAHASLSLQPQNRYQFLPVHVGGHPTSSQISALPSYNTLEELHSSTGGYESLANPTASPRPSHDHVGPLQILPTQAAAAVVERPPPISPGSGSQAYSGSTLEDPSEVSSGSGEVTMLMAAGNQSVLFLPIPTSSNTTTNPHTFKSSRGNTPEPMDIEDNSSMDANTESYPQSLLGDPPSFPSPGETVELETTHPPSSVTAPGHQLGLLPQSPGGKPSSQEGLVPPGSATPATCPPPGSHTGVVTTPLEGVNQKRRQAQITGAQSTTGNRCILRPRSVDMLRGRVCV